MERGDSTMDQIARLQHKPTRPTYSKLDIVTGHVGASLSAPSGDQLLPRTKLVGDPDYSKYKNLLNGGLPE